MVNIYMGSFLLTKYFNGHYFLNSRSNLWRIGKITWPAQSHPADRYEASPYLLLSPLNVLQSLLPLPEPFSPSQPATSGFTHLILWLLQVLLPPGWGPSLSLIAGILCPESSGQLPAPPQTPHSSLCHTYQLWHLPSLPGRPSRPRQNLSRKAVSLFSTLHSPGCTSVCYKYMSISHTPLQLL